MNERFSVESRQALFAAMVVAHAAGETEVQIDRILCALVRTAVWPEAGSVAASVDDQAFERVLKTVVENLSEAHIGFGSREHIVSLEPLPLASQARTALENLRTVLAEVPSSTVSPAHILLALAEEPSVTGKLSDMGIVREHLVGSARRLAT